MSCTAKCNSRFYKFGNPETMTETIQTVLAPLLIIGSFCNLNFFEYPLGQPRPYFTCLYFLIKWILFVYVFYYFIYNSYFALLYITWPYMIIMITVIVLMIVSLFRFKELKMCLHKLSIVDDTLEMLGTSKEYRRLRKWIILIIFGWIILSLFMNVFDCFWLNYQYFSITHICIPFVGNHLFQVNVLSALTWRIILKYISSRFQQVNKHIHVLYLDLLENNANCTRRNRLINQRRIECSNKECKLYMWIIMHVHLQLCFISRELNKLFSVQMIVQLTSYFTFIVELYRQSYTLYIERNSIKMLEHLNIFTYMLMCLFWGILYTIIIVTLNHVCQTVYCKANETLAILYKLSNNNFNEDLREQILQFILQIKQTEIKFGSGLCCFGNDFIRQFYKSIVTVLVIVIQMRSIFQNSSFDQQFLSNSN